MASENLDTSYPYEAADPTWSSQYLWTPVVECVREKLPSGGRVFEVGCGNGAAAAMLGRLGYDVTGVDPSGTGIEIARRQTGFTGKIAVGSAYDDLASSYGQFPVVVSLEVVEHCFYPRKFARTVYDLLEPGGIAIISTPYHGYLKNVALAVFNKFDSHWSPMWDGGHIKFWSRKTLAALLVEAGFADVRFLRAGRIPVLAKSMIAIARKPATAAH